MTPFSYKNKLRKVYSFSTKIGSFYYNTWTCLALKFVPFFSISHSQGSVSLLSLFSSSKRVRDNEQAFVVGRLCCSARNYSSKWVFRFQCDRDRPHWGARVWILQIQLKFEPFISWSHSHQRSWFWSWYSLSLFIYFLWVYLQLTFFSACFSVVRF